MTVISAVWGPARAPLPVNRLSATAETLAAIARPLPRPGAQADADNTFDKNTYRYALTGRTGNA